MNKQTQEYLKQHFGISDEVLAIAVTAEEELSPQFRAAEEVAEFNQLKILKAFQDNRVSYAHFAETSGYGYDDLGRDTLDKIYAQVFGTEDAYVRVNIISGTQAISTCLFGVLRPGDTLLSVCGKPYDTLHEVIDCGNNNFGSLADWGVKYKQVDLRPNGHPGNLPVAGSANPNDGLHTERSETFKKVDHNNITSTILRDSSIKAVLIQRSKGYELRKSLDIDEIENIINTVKSANPNIICIIDNCYGEFTETREPTEVGADLVVGSLIKNPGGSLAPTGGYIVGKTEFVELAANRHTAPGLGKHVGASLGFNKQLYQGLFIASHIVLQSLKTAMLCAKIFEKLGYDVCPTAIEKRTDIIQAIKFGDKEKLINFCRAIQANAPIDSFVTPEPWAMPGYDSEVIMAAGAFVQGASIELSADAPIREPFVAFLQGGITYESAKVAIIKAASDAL